MGKFNKNLKMLLCEYNLTQEKFADKIGVSRQTVNNYITGKTTPNTQILIDISNYFNIDVMELIN